ncbi:MAG TPA: hypothetical protein VGW10_19160 [Solirubrobacteraceae bacterium]|nr:hypothetical protein [Solirubrobacteraceae bacterium]
MSAAPALTLALIATHGVNVPWYDQWFGLVPFLQEHQAGSLGAGELYAQHNEHRPVVPRTTQILLAQLTDWDIRAELALNFAVALATFVLVALALRRTLERAAFAIAGVVASIVLFSTSQWESWLWGWQLEWFLSSLAAIGACWSLTFLLERSRPAGLAVGAACAIVASFSLGHGTVVWPVGLALLVLRGRPWRVWAALGVLTFVAYYAEYIDPPFHPSKTVFLEQPLELARYVVLYVGSPFGHTAATGAVAGLGLVATFLAGAAYVVRHRADRALLDRSSFWLATGAYALGAAAITGVARVGHGWQQAGSSRYATVGALFAVSTLALVFAIAPRHGLGTRALALIALVLALPALYVTATRGIDRFEGRGDELRAQAACVHRVRSPTDPCLRRSPASPDVKYDAVLYLRAAGLAGF